MAAGVIGLDQFSKLWAVETLRQGQIRPLLPGLLQLQRVSNTGAAFSLFSQSTLMLALVSGAVSLGIILWILMRPPQRFWPALALALLLAGAAGNGIDRWRLGAVIDFLEFVPIHFPIFNLADIAINAAVACFLIDLIALPRSSRSHGPDAR
ncbi:MAG: signal peptidase II [Synechococcaceae cyanobacterium]|nr:signal peptidase II [Synechococcaceae cyanobacterium]